MNWMAKVAGGCGLVAGVVVAGCDATDGFGPGTGGDPRGLEAEYSWVFERWEQGDAQGFPVVELTWGVPALFNREVFRVYARRASAGSYALVATVTSCSEGICVYQDRNVAGGQAYDYYVATFDERDGAEVGASAAFRVTVPQRPSLPAPTGFAAVSLDAAVFLRWTHTGAQRYLLVVQPENGSNFLIGETDGGSYLDDRAENGVHYRYFVASVDEQGHVSALSQPVDGFPRPDFHADIVYAHSDNSAASGFRFVADETQDPIVPGGSATAQWRFEIVNGVPRIQPLGQTAVTSGTFTSQLTCGPGSDANCVDVVTAPSGTAFGTASVVAQTGFTYVLRVTGSDDRPHYAKVRVQGASVDAQGRRLLVFDWAYQLRPDERSLNVVPTGG